MLSEGFYFNAMYKQNKATPLHEAAKQGDINVINNLVKIYPNNVSLPDQRGLTPLHYAALFDQQEAYNNLITQGADINYKDNYGRTAEDLLINHDSVSLSGCSEEGYCLCNIM